MKKVVTPTEMRDIDAFMISSMGIPGCILMENAAECVLREVQSAIGQSGGSVLILCGTGNNGGDGLALLRKLIIHGISAKAVILGEGKNMRGDAKLNFDIAKACGLPVKEVTGPEQLKGEFEGDFRVIVDGIFGTGLKRDVEGIEKQAVELSNAANAFKIAIDIPSGIDGLTGQVKGCAFKADVTVAMQYLKRGLLLYPGREYAGKAVAGSIGLLSGFPKELNEEVLDDGDIKRILPQRKPDAHKGDSGKCLLVAGSTNLSGAAFMCALSALRAGCGLLKVAVPEGLKPQFYSLPEAMVFEAAERDWSEPDLKTVKETLEMSTCAAVGPGMGTGAEVASIVGEVLASGLPAVIDADGLNAISSNRKLLGALHEKVIITPHPAEMSRLSGKHINEILNDPVNAAREFSKEHGCIVHLKGATSVTASPDGKITYNLTGNPGLAKGGSGDVLTGIILALLGQKLDCYDATSVGAYLLGCAADKALELLRCRMLKASDVIGALMGDSL